MSDGRPNIVFVLCHNRAWGDFSCHGGGTATPRIDKLASEGIRFNNYPVEAQRRLGITPRTRSTSPSPPCRKDEK